MSRILICDDDKNTRHALTVLFECLNYQVDAADSGKKAIECIAKQDYSVILMDIDMPEMDGIEAIKNIRAIKQNQNVIIITGHKLSDLMEVAYKQLAVYDVVEKPFDMDYLKMIVAECIPFSKY